MDKFVCKGCGKCCRKFGKKGFPLFSFELEKINRMAKERNLVLDIRPVESIIGEDGVEDVALYGMFNEPCPFLSKDGKCSIHDDRFLICKQFPLFSTAKFKFGKGMPEFMECFSFDCEQELRDFVGDGKKSKEQIENYLKETYGECYDGCLESNKETERVMNWLIERGIKEG